MIEKLRSKYSRAVDPFDGYQVTGDYPANIDSIPGAVHLDDVSNPSGLREKAEQFLHLNPHILEGAARKGKDLVAYTTSHGKQIMVGVGITAVLTAVTAEAVVLYNARRRRTKR